MVEAKIDCYSILFPNQIEAIDLVHEIFIRNTYGKYDIINKSVIDIGGYVGSSAIYFISKGAKIVYTYEINKNCFTLLKRNINKNFLQDKIKAINIGIGKHNKKGIFYESKTNIGRSGVLIERYNDDEIKEKVSIDLIPISEILKTPIDIIKIDCEGSEYEILEDIYEKNLMHLINDGIILEGHNIDEFYNIEYLKTLVIRLGFKNFECYGKNIFIIYAYR